MEKMLFYVLGNKSICLCGLGDLSFFSAFCLGFCPCESLAEGGLPQKSPLVNPFLQESFFE